MSAEVKVDFVGKDAGLERSFGALDKYLTNSKKKVQELDKAAGNLGGPGGGIGKLAVGIGAANAAFGLLVGAIGKVADFTKSSVIAAAEAEKQFSRLSTVIKNNGSSYGLTARQISDYSNELARNTAFSSAANNEAAIFLATLKNVSAPTQFKETMKVSQDLATVFNMSLPAAARAVGKALDNPIQGMSNLRKYGVMLTEEQKRQVKSFMSVNDVASAQAIIMDNLKSKVNGAADAYGQTAVGQLERFKNVWGEIKENFGKGILDEVVKQSEEILKNSEKAVDASKRAGTVAGKVAGGAAQTGSWVANKGVEAYGGFSALVALAMHDPSSGASLSETMQGAYEENTGRSQEIRDKYKRQAEINKQVAERRAALAAKRNPTIDIASTLFGDRNKTPEGKLISDSPDSYDGAGPQLPGQTGMTKAERDAYVEKNKQDMTRISNNPAYANFTPGLLQFARGAMNLMPNMPGQETIVQMASQAAGQFAPKGFQSTYEDAQGMYDRINLSAGSKSDEAQTLEQTKKVADGIGAIVKDGVKIKNQIGAAFQEAAGAVADWF